jgi:hypothetical protein
MHCFFAASTISFDDSNKQKKYETISFKELREEIQSLKVQPGIIQLGLPRVACH